MLGAPDEEREADQPGLGGVAPATGDLSQALASELPAPADSLKPRPPAARQNAKRTVSTTSTGRRDRGPHAEPLLGAVGFKPLYLGEPQLRREAHRASVGSLGKEHHRLAG